ncbi:MAG: class I SAM-dependent methyltransferase [Proteobacteria bacterium]|nr:class I SAM-dependent methyltransferase [Pseudomonadota bacterium]
MTTGADRRGILSRLKLYGSMVRYGLAHNRDFARENWTFFSRMIDRLGALDRDPRGLKVLDLGCGKSYWLALLLAGYGAEAVGVDTEPVAAGFSPAKYVRVVRSQGLERAVRTAVWDLVFGRPYYRALAECAEFPLDFSKPRLMTMSGDRLDFEDHAFDLVVSHEVFEHLPDLAAAVAETARILKPGGLTYIYVHNYASLSGGHHIAWKYPDREPSDVVPPWDHLRENRYPDVPSWINRLRMDDYRRVFETRFEILDWQPGDVEGPSLLTPDIRRELADYSEEELLLKGFTVIARPL